VDVIDIFDADNENIKVWVNSYTHLPVRQRWYRREESTGYRYEEVTHYTKYRAANNGVMWPMDLQRERDTERIAEIYDEQVKIDVSLKEEIFLLPSGAKMLPKEKT
jgi:hypothetical protein